MDENPFPEAGFSKLFTEDESDSDSEQVKVQPAIIREGNKKRITCPRMVLRSSTVSLLTLTLQGMDLYKL